MWTGWAERGAGEGAEGRRGDLATVTAERGAGLQLPPHRPALPSGKPGLALVGVDRCLQAVLGALGFRRGAKVGTPWSRYVGLAEGKSAGRTGASGSLSNRSPSICWAVHSIVQGASESERGVCAVLEAGLVPALEGGARLRLPAPDAADGGWESPGLGVRAPGAARARGPGSWAKASVLARRAGSSLGLTRPRNGARSPVSPLTRHQSHAEELHRNLPTSELHPVRG